MNSIRNVTMMNAIPVRVVSDVIKYMTRAAMAGTRKNRTLLMIKINMPNPAINSSRRASHDRAVPRINMSGPYGRNIMGLFKLIYGRCASVLSKRWMSSPKKYSLEIIRAGP